MLDYILTTLIPLVLAFSVLWKSEPSETQDFWMKQNYTQVLKGICCIIVIFIHIPNQYTNKLQEGIGSFAYICVTLFFLMSAYGMSLSKDKKANYLTHFWRNRLSALLIPMLLVNICSTSFGLLTNGGGAVKCFSHQSLCKNLT